MSQWLGWDGKLARILFGAPSEEATSEVWPPTQHANLISPSGLVLESDAYRTGRLWTTTLFIEGFPNRGQLRMLRSLYAQTGTNVDVSFHINPIDRSTAIDGVETAMHDLEVAVAKKQDTGDTSSRRSARRLSETQAVYDRLTAGVDELHDVGVYITIRAESHDRVIDAAAEIRDLLARQRLTAKDVAFRQQDGLISGSPIAKDTLEYSTKMVGSAVGTLTPFSSSSLIEEDGVLLGYHAMNRSPIVVDRFNRENGYNIFIVGKIGSGKSFTAKLNLLRMYAMDPEIVVIIMDPMGEFKRFTETLNGEHIPINGQRALNALEIQEVPDHVLNRIETRDHDPFKQAKTSALDLLNTFILMQGEGVGLTKEERAFMEVILNIAYARKGITADPKTHGNESPTITDLIGILHEVSQSPLPFRIVAEFGDEGITPDALADYEIAEPLDVQSPHSVATDSVAQSQDPSGETRTETDSVSALSAIDSQKVERLRAGGIETIGDVARADPKTIKMVADVNESTATRWVDTASQQLPVATNGTGHIAGPLGSVSPEEFGLVEADLNEYRDLARSLRMALTPFRPGHQYHHLAQPTDIDLTASDLLYLDLEESETEQEQSLMMKLMYRLIYERAKRTTKKTILAVDEAHMPIQDDRSLNWLERSTRHSRHHNLSIQLMTQHPDDLLSQRAAKIIGDNTDIQIYHRLDDINEEARDYLDLTAYEVDYIKSVTPGNAGAGYTDGLLAVAGEGHYPLRVEALPEEVQRIDPSAVKHV